METEKNLWASWEKYQSVAGENSEMEEKRLEELADAVCGQISADAVCFSRLGEADEDIFVHLKAVMEVYRRVTELAGEFSFADPAITALMDGICEVLSSRLREFCDAAADTQGNPIKAEKLEILSEVSQTTRAALESCGGNVSAAYEIYLSGLKSCLSRLNDLHGRKSARFYTELIEREFEELGNIVKLQRVNAAIPIEQAIAVSGILDALSEAYRMTEPVVANFQALQSAPQKNPVRTFEEFENVLGAAIMPKSPPPPEIAEFFAALDANSAALFEGIDTEYKRAAYSLQRIVGAKILLAEEITAGFEKTLENLTIAGDETENDILSGICETVEIKIAGLRESVQNFARQTGDTIKKFSEEKDAVDDSERLAILQDIRTAWLENPPQSEDDVPDFFASCGEFFVPVFARVKLQTDDYTAKLEKSAFRFKKEVLLYEICTFEEILTHSVSHLRDSENADVSAAAELLDSTFCDLEVILKKNNITVIRPLPGEIFNAKEHEILVAEKQDGREKGEIIKIVTAGYRLANSVILRANVIAAR